MVGAADLESHCNRHPTDRSCDLAKALQGLREGQDTQQQTVCRLWEPELHRLEGIALVGLNRVEEGQAAIEEAQRIARRQQAKSYELRAATSLASLLGSKAGETTRAIASRRFTAGSPRASTPPT
jgi:hypothetical protein